MGCDTVVSVLLSMGICFNPRTHMGCDWATPSPSTATWSFNPRTHMGCDRQAFHPHFQGGDVSIHAPTWGATYRHMRQSATCGGFNPRTHMGCDFIAVASGSSSSVSIHAPTWGATGVPHFLHPQSPVSIHAPTWGATSMATTRHSTSSFQSTHPHGVRRTLGSACRTPRSFNPRTHMGCDYPTPHC